MLVIVSPKDLKHHCVVHAMGSVRQDENIKETSRSCTSFLSHKSDVTSAEKLQRPVFDPLGIDSDKSLGLNATWESALGLLSQTFGSTSSTKKDKSASGQGVAAAIEDSSIDFGDFFKGPLPGKFLKLLGLLALSRLGVYVPLGGVNREAFVGNLDQNSLLTTLDSFSGGGIGRLGICSLGIVPFINAQIVFQLLTQIYPKLQDLQKREGGNRKKKSSSVYSLCFSRFCSSAGAIGGGREVRRGGRDSMPVCK
ncbi:Preprotein translocase subunit SCY1, chloroplastic [Vitis vinifera]|uniref:Preprotein translocase subunit SCY1, chloroplastic n=1 Tax=Vitis vinifera TaxID=29760 RepID=A0A438G7R4_VITVI|nr:Preprotein translocase subunit SCY1, chloroplastic [Vitis vinifera]